MRARQLIAAFVLACAASAPAFAFNPGGGGSGVAASTVSVSTPLSGNGSGASPITLLSSSATLQGNTFNGNGQLVQLSAAGKLPAVDGSQLTNLAAGFPSTGAAVGSNIAGAGTASSPLTLATTSSPTFSGANIYNSFHLIASTTIPTAVTSVAFSGLSANASCGFHLVMIASTTNTNIAWNVNSDVTTSDYHVTGLYAQNGTTGNVNANDARICQAFGDAAYCEGDIWLDTSGYPRFLVGSSTNHTATSFLFYYESGYLQNTQSDITTLTFLAGAANALQPKTQILLYSRCN